MIHYNFSQHYCKENFRLTQEIPEFILTTPVDDFLRDYAPYQEIAKPLFEHFFQKYDHRIEMLAVEFLVSNSKYRYAGRCDLLFRLDGRVVLGDIKTSKAIYEDYSLQLGAYGNCDQFSQGLYPTPQDYMIIRIHPYKRGSDPLKIQINPDITWITKKGEMRYRGWDHPGPHYEFKSIIPDFPAFLKRRRQLSFMLEQQEKEQAGFANPEDELFGK